MSEYEQIMARLDRIESLAAIQSKDILTVEEAAIYTGFSEDYLYRDKGGKGKPAYIMIGKCVRYAKKDLLAWMERKRIKPQDEIDEEADRYLLGKRNNARAGKR